MRSKLSFGAMFVVFCNFAHAQFQQHWVFERPYPVLGDGQIVSAVADSVGGIFLGIETRDTSCFYSLGNIDHTNATGNVDWQSSLYYESPCESQVFQGMLVGYNRIYFTGYDTVAWLGQMTKSGSGAWRNDSTYGMILGDFDGRAKLSAFHYQLQASSVFLFDTLGNPEWYYAMPYSFVHGIRKIQSGGANNQIVFFEYTNSSQAETLGVGVLMLDTVGNYVWDTLINPATMTGDADLYVDAAVDNSGNSYILSRDQTYWGAFITKLDPLGNGVANSSYVTTPNFSPKQLVVDTLNGLVYVAGRDAADLIILKYNTNLLALDTMRFSINVPITHSVAVNESGQLFHMWVSDTGVTKQLRLEIFGSTGLLVDTYTYWDTTKFSSIITHSIVFDQLGGIFLVCNAKDTLNQDIGLVIKLSNPLGSNENVRPITQLDVYPNPASSSVTISLPELQKKNAIYIFNSTGQVLYTATCVGSSVTLSTATWPTGIYFIEVISESGQRYTEKLIIQR